MDYLDTETEHNVLIPNSGRFIGQIFEKCRCYPVEIAGLAISSGGAHRPHLPVNDLYQALGAILAQHLEGQELAAS